MLRILLIVLVLCLKLLMVNTNCLWNHSVDVPTVNCQLRMLDFRRNTSSSIPGLQAAQVLKIQCSDDFFFESELRSDHFESLKKLDHLSIEYCKIRQLPPRSFVGLSNLRSLKINTYNSDWTSLVLQPDYEAFVGLNQLQKLDLTQNNIETLPQGLLCPLTKLKVMNLSNNYIQDLKNLGLSDHLNNHSQCFANLQVLHLSYNEITSLNPFSLKNFTNIQILDLSHNSIGVLMEDTFKMLTNLEDLNLSHNRLVSLPPNIFSSNNRIREINVSNNSIGSIEINAFRNLSSLKVLNLSGNSLDENWIRPGIFQGLENLKVLDLSSNYISKIDVKLFSDLTSLQILNLNNNKIHTMDSNSFISQNNLQILSLSHNQLESIYRQTLIGLTQLKSLTLNNNKIHSLQVEALKNCSKLQELSLSHNFLTQVPKALHHMTALINVDLSSNVIGVLKRESLQGLPKLIRLKLGRNELSRLGEGSFKEVANLKHLDLSGNRFEKLDQDTFSQLKTLQSLDLSRNELDDINGLLQTQIHLKWLNISNNKLAWFDYAFIPPSVEWLDIHSNRIDALGNYYNLEDKFQLKYLDASENKITELNPKNILPSNQYLYLAKNEIANIQPNTFISKHKLKQVHLEKNNLAKLSRASLHVSPQQKNPPIFYLAKNPLICDCNLQWLKHINSRVMSRLPQVMDLDKISCAIMNAKNGQEFSHRRISLVEDNEFLCQYEKHCPSNCMCCDFFACDCQMKCPDGCTCFHDQRWSANIIQCANTPYKNIPKNIPMDTTSLYLDNNNITELQSGSLVGRSQLIKLSMNNSQLAIINNQSFSGLDNLRILNLGFNKLKSFKGFEFSQLTSLQELRLEHNQLVSIHQDTFKNLKQLKLLHLDGNLLISFPVWQLSSNLGLQSLTLANNWWQCDCEFVRKFRMFIDGNVNIIHDYKEITCTSSEISLSNFSECSNVLAGSIGEGFHFSNTFGYEELAIGIGIIFGCVGFIILIILFVKIKEMILVWLHSSYGIRISFGCPHRKDESSNEILFDAFILYSLKDEKFVMDDLVKPLNHSYNLSLMHKDFAGIYSSEAFKTALTASSRHIIVLSQGFFATEWDYVKELILFDYILILANDVTKIEIKSGMYKQASSLFKNAKKILQWSDDESFWKILRYYLPEPSKVSTKEGGAELDVSGVWTFTSMENTIVTAPENTNASVFLSPEKIISTPEAFGVKNNLNQNSPMVNSSFHGRQLSFPAPPVKKKQPHQCSTHYLAAGASSINDQNPRVFHQYSSSDSFYQYQQQQPIIRRNNVHHQRSSSTVAQQHQRSQSAIVHQESIIRSRPPTPPPKIRSRNNFYNPNVEEHQETSYFMSENPYNVPKNSFLSRLVADSGNHEMNFFTPNLNSENSQPQEPTSSLALIPLSYSRSPTCHLETEDNNHIRSSSLMENARPHLKHHRSSSTLTSSASAAIARRHLHQRSSSGVTRTSSMLVNNDRRQQIPRELLNNKPPRFLDPHYQSPISKINNRRSSSTPYEGFVL